MKKISLLTIVVALIIILGVIGIVLRDSKNNGNTLTEDNTSKNTEDILLEDFNESVVIRSFSKTSVSPGDKIDIIINVFIINNETFYAIEESFPSEFTFISGKSKENIPLKPVENNFAWIWIKNAPFPMSAKIDPFTYTVQAPLSTGNYAFDGIYQFEGFANTLTTKGQTTVTVT